MDAENQIIKLTADIKSQPTLVATTIIHLTVENILHQTGFALAAYPELVELAVVAMGLGMPRSRIEFVKQVSAHWDSTLWGAFPRPFLDSQSLAYANALSAWARGEKKPGWMDAIAVELRKPMRTSLKHLHRTGDSFFQPDSQDSLLNQPQTDWLHLAADSSASRQIIAVRHFEENEMLADDQEQILMEKLRSPNRFVALHALAAIDYLGLATEPIENELCFLVDTSDEELQAKTMITLAQMGPLNEDAIESATKMVGSQAGHVSFAGMVGLLSLDSVTPDHLKAVDRGFRRSLQTCDFEFVELFATAYCKWLNDPRQHVQKLLSDDQPEYVEIATNAIEDVQRQLVAAE